MVATVQLRDYAFLSQAAYRGLSSLPTNVPVSELERELKSLDTASIGVDNVFAPDQAKLLTGSTTPSDLTDGYIFLNQLPNTDSGFSATAFKGKGGHFVIAIRGTEPTLFSDPIGAARDLLDADVIGVALSGKAKRLLFDACRY